jgi:RNA-splicing ligase RtcB
MCDQEFTRGSKVRIMPDVHAGIGCTIGTTMTVQDKAVPNVVGVDIGCGMYTVELGREPLDFARLDEACHVVPSGRNVWSGRKERFDLLSLRCYRDLRDAKRLGRSLGTLGGGNHFIEVDCSSDGNQFLVIHSGSRNLGTQVAKLYQDLAVDLAQGKDEYFQERDRIIREYKEAGRRSEIQAALKERRNAWKAHELSVPKELCWLYGPYLDDYLHDIEICQQFARRNREVMADTILQLCGLSAKNAFHTVHNYIDTQEMILRKGAIAAHKDEVVLIPINMRDGSIIARGKGNPEWNYSAPHGAGRVMSRTDAQAKLDFSDYKAAMEGIYTTSVSESTLDEAPMAYKSIDEIVGAIGEAVDIIEVLKPVYNFKA